jgi:catechol-2,3-dioxygenase
MPITRLNHAVLYVRDVEVSRGFYEEALGFTTLVHVPGQAAFLRAPGSTNDHDLGLFQIGSGAGPSAAGRSTVGLYHLAWEVDTLEELGRLRDELAARGALVGASDHLTTKSLYVHDPDGLEFEVCWILPAAVLTPELVAAAKAAPRPQPLDLDAEKARYGAQTRGGVGVSMPAPEPTA